MFHLHGPHPFGGGGGGGGGINPHNRILGCTLTVKWAEPFQIAVRVRLYAMNNVQKSISGDIVKTRPDAAQAPVSQTPPRAAQSLVM
jgi:hypothetical protein